MGQYRDAGRLPFRPARHGRGTGAGGGASAGARADAAPEALAMAGELRVNAKLERGYGRYGHLPGFLKGRAGAQTVNVEPPSLLAGASGSVNVTVSGAKAT